MEDTNDLDSDTRTTTNLPEEINIKTEYVDISEEEEELNTANNTFLDDITENSTNTNNTSTKTSKKRQKCEICQKECVHLSTHMRTHTSERPFLCDICNKTFTTNSQLKVHKRIHTGIKPYTCDLCGKTFADLSNLRRHQIIHKGVKPYKCQHCNMSFSQHSSLIRHKRIHTREKLLEHEQSGKRFRVKLEHLADNRKHSIVLPFGCGLCEKSFPLKYSLTRHLQQVHKDEITEDNKIEKCESCQKEFIYLIKHLCTQTPELRENCNKPVKTSPKESSHTEIKPHSCDICGKSFANYSNFRRHQIMHQGIRLHKCQHCKKPFTERSTMVLHQRIHSEDKPFSCQHCEEKFYRKSQLVIHKKKCKNGLSYDCGKCEKSFLLKNGLTRHLLKVHNVRADDSSKAVDSELFHLIKSEEQSESENCEPPLEDIEEIYLTVSNIKEEPEDIEPFQELTSDETSLDSVATFSTSAHSNTDVATGDIHTLPYDNSRPTDDIKKSKEEKETYKCKICNIPFSTELFLEQHKQTHTVPKYKCEVCDKQYPHKSKLEGHIKQVHSNLNPHICDICGNRYEKKPQLVTHKLIHSDIRSFSCDQCKKSYKWEIQLINHKKLHSGEKPFKCDQCNMAFTYKSSLTNHKRIHTTEKSFKCDVCKERFFNKSHFNKHKKIHLKLKIYKCDYCVMSFSSDQLLSDHKLIHTSAKLEDSEFCCNFCDEKFLSHLELKEHQFIHDTENQNQDNEYEKSDRKNGDVVESIIINHLHPGIKSENQMESDEYLDKNDYPLRNIEEVYLGTDIKQEIIIYKS